MSWTTITATSVDADSPIDEDLMGDLNDNVTYLHDTAIRCGTHTIPVRRVLAVGSYTDTAAVSGGDTAVTSQAVVFATDSDDGDPNFGTAPRVMLTAVEYSGADDWGTGASIKYWVDESTITTTGFTFVWQVVNTTGTNVGVIMQFAAFGKPAAGE